MDEIDNRNRPNAKIVILEARHLMEFELSLKMFSNQAENRVST